LERSALVFTGSGALMADLARNGFNQGAQEGSDDIAGSMRRLAKAAYSGNPATLDIQTFHLSRNI
jgi:hypothetical protein